MRATKIFKWEMAHKLSQSYTNKCQHIHGHSYRAEVTFEASSVDEEGVVVDFTRIKEKLGNLIDCFDHSFMFYEKDDHIAGAVKEQLMNAKRRLIECDFEPTAENIAAFLFGYLEVNSLDLPNYPKVCSVKVWETATCFAEATSGEKPLHIRFVSGFEV